MRKPRGVVITPFDTASQRVGAAVRHSLQELGVEIFYFDELQPGASWANAVSDAIGSADFIVADISRPNANVLYELGHAHALRKPSILLRSLDADSRPPEALVGYHYIAYDSTNLRDLEQDVQRAAQRYVERVASEP
jgi:nucleoside 2-deoxyribosyltransferase